MDDDQQTTKTSDVPAHRGTMLQVVYTSEEYTLERVLGMCEEWPKSEKHKIMGLDLEYTPNRHAVALVQIAMCKHVLLYH